MAQENAPMTQQGEYKTIVVPAKPEPIAIAPATTAAVVVDMQNDFCTTGGMFERTGIDISGARQAVRRTADILASIRKAGMSVVFLKMGFRPDLSDFGSDDSP